MPWKYFFVFSTVAILIASPSLAAPLNYRSCKTSQDAAVCDSRCESIGEVEFRVSVEWSRVVRWSREGTHIVIQNLGFCGVWDKNNWQCVENDGDPYVYRMIDGHFTQRLKKQADDKEFCAK